MVVYKSRKIMPPELIVPEPPPLGRDLLDVFWKLFKREGITFQEIYYFQEIYNLELSGEDIDIIMHLSNFAVKWISKREKKDK